MLELYINVSHVKFIMKMTQKVVSGSSLLLKENLKN